jgi:hypothetical protein
MIVESSCGGQVSKECILSIFKLIERSDSTNPKSDIRNLQSEFRYREMEGECLQLASMLVR